METEIRNTPLNKLDAKTLILALMTVFKSKYRMTHIPPNNFLQLDYDEDLGQCLIDRKIVCQIVLGDKSITTQNKVIIDLTDNAKVSGYSLNNVLYETLDEQLDVFWKGLSKNKQKTLSRYISKFETGFTVKSAINLIWFFNVDFQDIKFSRGFQRIHVSHIVPPKNETDKIEASREISILKNKISSMERELEDHREKLKRLILARKSME